MRLTGLVLCALLVAAPAFAQSAYVVGSFGVEVSRLSRVESGGFEFPGGDGEALGGALRVGTELGDRWGLELEFAHAATIEDETTQNPRILPATGFVFTSLGTAPVGGIAPEIPIFVNYTLRVRRSNPTLSTVAWIRQPVGGSVDLVYLGGVAFSRSVQEQDTSFVPILRPIPLLAPSRVTRTTMYGVNPLVGVEGRIRLTEHVRLVPGVRLQGLDSDPGSGWLMRAGVGLGWFF
ncbi:MAG: hypothetical protein ACRD09_00740 [Vicinamibacterales bacterium]